MTEIWKDIAGYEGWYKVSNYGNVKSLDRVITYSNGVRKLTKGKQLVPVDIGNGYYRVTLTKNGKYTNKFIHRLVAEAFIPNPGNLPIINHKDEDPSNNNVDNLEWCSYAYNSNYGTCIERRSKKRSRPIKCYDKNNNLIKSYESVRDAVIDLRGCNGGRIGDKIRMVANGKRKICLGLIWRWADAS